MLVYILCRLCMTTKCWENSAARRILLMVITQATSPSYLLAIIFASSSRVMTPILGHRIMLDSLHFIRLLVCHGHHMLEWSTLIFVYNPLYVCPIQMWMSAPNQSPRMGPVPYAPRYATILLGHTCALVAMVLSSGQTSVLVSVSTIAQYIQIH